MKKPTVNNKAAIRLAWVDILRGIAIILMIPANLAPSLQSPHAILFRLLASYAAPIFITLCAGMVVLNSHSHSWRYYIIRAYYVLIIAVMVDIIVWRILPFHAFDILYIISLTLPIAFLAKSLSYKALVFITLVCFMMSSVMQQMIGYSYEVLEINISSPVWVGVQEILSSFFIDGWFPVFPWIGFASLGVGLFRYLFNKNMYQVPTTWLLVALLMLIIGYSLLFTPLNWFPNLVNGGILAERNGYIEIFYPPTAAFLCTTIGIIVFFARFSQKLVAYNFSKIIAKFGQYSLFVYIMHIFIGQYLIKVPLEAFGLDMIADRFLFGVIILVVYISIYFMLICLDKIKTLHSPSSAFMQLLIGR